VNPIDKTCIIVDFDGCTLLNSWDETRKEIKRQDPNAREFQVCGDKEIDDKFYHHLKLNSGKKLLFVDYKSVYLTF
jgi:hypothetical protein